MRVNVRFQFGHSLHRYSVLFGFSTVPSLLGWLVPLHSNSVSVSWMCTFIDRGHCWYQRKERNKFRSPRQLYVQPCDFRADWTFLELGLRECLEVYLLSNASGQNMLWVGGVKGYVLSPLSAMLRKRLHLLTVLASNIEFQPLWEFK